MASIRSSEQASHSGFGPVVPVGWLAAHRAEAGVLVVDVRPRDEYLAAHIPGSIQADIATLRLPASRPSVIEQWTVQVQDSIRALGITPRHRVVFVEAYSGTLAATGVWLLDATGLRNGAMLDGGLIAWQTAGHDLVDDDPGAPAPSTTTITLDHSVLATADGLDQGIAAGTSRRIDTRTPLEYSQGAIPGSDNVDWQNHLDQQGALRDRDALTAMYEDIGTDEDVTTYCAGGFRASHTYVVLKSLGYTRVSNYMPSWGEWSQRRR